MQWVFFFCSSSVCKSENHHFDFKVCPLPPLPPLPPPPRCIILLFQLFLSATPPHSGCSPSSDSRALWLFPSVCFTHADVLISDKTTGRIRRMTGKKLHLCVCVCVLPHIQALILCFYASRQNATSHPHPPPPPSSLNTESFPPWFFIFSSCSFLDESATLPSSNIVSVFH